MTPSAWGTTIQGLGTELTAIIQGVIPAIWPVFALLVGVSLVVYLLAKFGIRR
jgi:predicted permease